MGYLDPTAGQARESGTGFATASARPLQVHNATGGSLAAGTLVYLSGYDTTSGLPQVVASDADAGGTPAEYIIRDAIANGSNGYVYKTHRLTAQNTNSASAVGDPVYLSTTAGGWTLTAPSGADDTVQRVGVVVTKSATVGIIDFNLDTPVAKVGTNELQDSSVTLVKQSVPKIGKISQTVLISEFTDGTGTSGTKTMTTQIPAGAVFLYSRVLVNVALSGDTTAVLTIGDGSDVDRYNTGTPSVLTTGQKEMGAPSGNRDHLTAATVTLTVTGASDFGLVNTLGSLTVDLYYLQTV